MQDIIEILRGAFEGKITFADALERAIDEIERLREKERHLDLAVVSLQRLARLGAGEQLGNSDGNVMAQKALLDIGYAP